jgi:hypothetical protein
MDAHRPLVLAEHHVNSTAPRLSFQRASSGKTKKTIVASDVFSYCSKPSNAGLSNSEMKHGRSRGADCGRVYTDHGDRRHSICRAAAVRRGGSRADECRDEAVVQLHGGHVVRVSCSLDEVLAWFA